MRSGGTAVSATVLAGAYEEVFSGGRASGATVNNGGHQDVFSGGATSGSILNSGGLEVVAFESALFNLDDDGPPNYGISVLELRNGKIAPESIYVAERFDASEWCTR